MAEKLTQDENWALYWTDLDYYNFAVDPSGKLSVIDVENVIVVDRHAVKLGMVTYVSNDSRCSKLEQKSINGLHYKVRHWVSKTE